MTILSTKVFGGEVPRVPADKLPDGKAQSAVNCNFAYSELRGARSPFQLTRLANAAKSIFSLDGVTFYSWPYRTKAWKGPVINDAFDRVYFTSQSGGLRVAQTTGTRIDGGEPATSYKAGVPAVAAAPTYTLQNRTSLPDFPNAVIKLFSYFEADGKRFGEREITAFQTLVPFREFSFNVDAPSGTSGAPADFLSEGSRTIKLSSIIVATQTEYFSDGESGQSYGYTTSQQTVELGGSFALVITGDAVLVGATLYTGVVSMQPEGDISITPGAFLSARSGQVGGSTPLGASPSVRVDLVDPSKNETIFTLSASSTVASSVSDAVPGGVEAKLIKDGVNAGQWKLVLDYGAIDTRAYVVTMVNQWNEESEPSPPVVVSPTYVQTVLLTFNTPSFSEYVPCNKFRVYRSLSSGSYISVTETPQTFDASTWSYSDTALTVKTTDAVLASIGWDLPPASLKGLTLLPNGFFAGFSGDTMYFSEPYRPWAWPYSLSFPVPLVGMRAIENSLVVTTNSYPYLVSGVHPSSMTQAQLSTSQAGVSDHGMCLVGNTVAYISNDGLAIITGYNVDFATSQQLWTREVWKARFGGILQDLELAYHDGAVVCGTATAGKMWEIRLDSEGGGNLTSLSSVSDALYVLPASDQLYLVQGQNLMQYNGSATTPSYEWWSRDYILPKPTVLTAGYINCAGPVTVTVYADGVQRYQGVFYAAGYFRMPSGSKALRWSYKLSGTGTVKEISLSERRQELRSV
jgi:hypothetical protein